MSQYFKKIFAIVIIILPILSFADVSVWQLIPEKSSLIFTATQNNAPVSGKFKKFAGDIHFDPAQLKASHVRIVIDMSSVSTDYADVADTLKTAEWFNVVSFPQAVFTAENFTQTGNHSYQANGTLTIRDKTVPVVMIFTLEGFSQTTARAKGSAMLKRLAFEVGQGEWQKTDNVQDEVQVQFTVAAIKK